MTRYVSHAVVCTLLLLIDLTLEARVPIKYNGTLEDESKCYSGWSCHRPENCKTIPDTVFQCSHETSALKICCETLQSETGSPTTGRPKSTAVVTIPTTRLKPVKTMKTIPTVQPTLPLEALTEKLSSVWKDASPSIRSKAAQMLPQQCGKTSSDDRITNGEQARFDQFPWMALLIYLAGDAKMYGCGGSIISKRYVLTAAHCATVNNVPVSYVRFGEWNLTSPNRDCIQLGPSETDCVESLDIEVDSVTVHPGFGSILVPYLQNDIALIRIKEDLKFTFFISPICLSPVVQMPTNYTVSGWGVRSSYSADNSPILLYVGIEHYDFAECNGVAPSSVRPLNETTQFCAGGQDGLDACKGDSGGPLIYNHENAVFQKGVVSQATYEICGRERRPTIYTEVAAFVPWILDNMKP